MSALGRKRTLNDLTIGAILEPDRVQTMGRAADARRFNDLGFDLPPILTVEPRAGRLVLFSSTMWHGTLPLNRG